MYCLGLALTLRPGAYDNYKLAHDQIWPELAEGMRAHPVSMAIYRDGERVFIFAAAPNPEDWEKSRADPVLARWDARMAQHLQTDDSGRLAFTVLPKAFGFGDYQ
jgi:L-rhamnose mutarotase